MDQQTLSLLKLVLMTGTLAVVLVEILPLHGQSSDQATNAPTSPPSVSPSATPSASSFDFQKAAPVLQLPDPWSLMTPEALLKVQMFYAGVINGQAGGLTFTSGFTYGKGVKVNFFTGELVIVSVYSHALTPELMLAGYQRGMKEVVNSSTSNLNGIISNFTAEQPYWNATVRSLVSPASWQNFDGSTSRIKIYLIPTQEYTLAIAVFGGTSKPDQIFTDAEQAMAKISLPGDIVEPPSWGEQMTVLLQQQNANQK